MLNNLFLKISQERILKDQKSEIGFHCLEETTISYDRKMVILWASCRLRKWYTMNLLQQKLTFNLVVPLRIEIQWNGQPMDILTQKRVSQKFAFQIKSEAAIRLKNSYYVLRPFEEKKKIEAHKMFSKSSLTNFNLNPILNTIEFFNCAVLAKYGTPILFTGMIN